MLYLGAAMRGPGLEGNGKLLQHTPSSQESFPEGLWAPPSSRTRDCSGPRHAAGHGRPSSPLPESWPPVVSSRWSPRLVPWACIGALCSGRPAWSSWRAQPSIRASCRVCPEVHYSRKSHGLAVSCPDVRSHTWSAPVCHTRCLHVGLSMCHSHGIEIGTEVTRGHELSEKMDPNTF